MQVSTSTPFSFSSFLLISNRHFRACVLELHAQLFARSWSWWMLQQPKWFCFNELKQQTLVTHVSFFFFLSELRLWRAGEATRRFSAVNKSALGKIYCLSGPCFVDQVHLSRLGSCKEWKRTAFRIPWCRHRLVTHACLLLCSCVIYYLPPLFPASRFCFVVSVLALLPAGTAHFTVVWVRCVASFFLCVCCVWEVRLLLAVEYVRRSIGKHQL